MAFLETIAPHLPRTKQTWHKLFVAGVVMVGQRIPETFFSVAMPALYRDMGLPLERFWMFGLIYLPSWFKFIWAPYLDRWTLSGLGRRRSWILASAISLSSSFFLIAFVEPSLDNLPIIIAIMLLTGFFFATGDIALDTYIIEMFDKDEQPFGGAINRLADVLVVFIAVSGLFWALGSVEWRTVLLVGGVILLGLGSFVLLRDEPPFPEVAKVNLERGGKVNIMRAVKQRHMLYVLPLTAALCAVAYTLILAPSAFLVDIGFDLEDVGYALGVPQTVSGIIGACVAAVLINWFGLKKAAWAFIGITLIGISGMLLLSIIPQPSLVVLTAIIFVWGFAAPLFVVLLITALYRWTSLTQTATDFTIMASAGFFGISLAPGLYGFIAGTLNWTAFYIISAGLIVALGVSFAKTHDKIQSLVDERNKREAALIAL